jgi:hypothetical protein
MEVRGTRELHVLAVRSADAWQGRAR